MQVHAVALGLGALWWVSQPSTRRWKMLTTVRLHDGIFASVPDGLLEQVQWLVEARQPRLLGMVALVVLVGSIGLVEGMVARRKDPQAGYGLWLWTVSLVGLALLPGAILGALVVPWPWPLRPVAWGLAGALGVVMYGLARGRPHTP
jgi:hypothetical protein